MMRKGIVAVVVVVAAAWVLWPGPGQGDGASLLLDDHLERQEPQPTLIEVRPPSHIVPGESDATRDEFEERSVSVHVVDEGGSPIDGARISFVSPSARLGATGSDGVAVISVPAVQDDDALTTLAVHATGFVGEQVGVPHEADRVDVVLAYGATITGTVRWHGTEIGVDGALVHAWPVDHSFDPFDLVTPHEAPLPVVRTETDPLGRFHFGELGPDRRYLVIAGQLGCASYDPPKVADIGTVDLVLELERTFGAIVELQDQGGAGLISPIGSYGKDGATTEFGGQEHIDFKFSSPMTLALMGLGREWAEVDGWSTRLLLATGPPDRSEVGPFVFRVDLPGYEPGRLSFWARSVSHGLPVNTLRLVRDTHCIAELRLVFSGAYGARGDLGEGRPLGSVHLHTATADLVELPVHRIGGDPVVYANIPCGEYKARFFPVENLFYHPPNDVPGAPVVLEAGRTTSWEVPLDGLGGMECAVVGPHGRPYTGPLTLTFSDTKRRRQRFIGFDHAPFRIDWLPPSEYEVRSIQPFHAVSGLVDVRAGVTSQVHLVGELGN